MVKLQIDEIFDFLTLLSAKGEVSDEIAGGVYVLRNKSKRVNVKVIVLIHVEQVEMV